MAKSKKSGSKIPKRKKVSVHLAHSKWLLLLFGVIFGITGAAFVYFSKAATEPYTMYRLSNGTYHYYTISAQERDNYLPYGWKVVSSTGYTNPSASSPRHVYKLYNTTNKSSWYYTMNYDEYTALNGKGWTGYGIGFLAATSPTAPSGYCRTSWSKLKAPGTTPRYIYTATATEINSLVAAGWLNLGVGFNLDNVCTTPAATTTTTTTTTPTTTPTTSTTPTANAGCDSTSLKKTDGSFWQCTFSEEFNGTSLDRSKWLVHKTANGGYKSGPVACFVDSPNNVSVGNGTLKLTARKEAASFPCSTLNSSGTANYTAGTVSGYNIFSQTYGRFEVRASVPNTNIKGLQTAFWMLPQNLTKYYTDQAGYAWPSSGEIDIVEIYSTYPDRGIPFLHYVSDPAYTKSENLTNNYCLINDVSKFHTYTLEWTSKTLTISYDGKVCMSTAWKGGTPLTGTQPFDQPFYMILTQALGVTNNGNGFDPATTPLPATTQVDYVRIWK